MGGGGISGLETWYPKDEGDIRCSKCDVILLCELVAHMGQHTYAFMKQALGTETVTVSGKVTGGVEATGKVGGAEVGGSISVVKGDWLITYLRKSGYKHMCTDCFRKAFPKDFAGILLSSVGKAKVINSQYEWIKMSYGTTQ